MCWMQSPSQHETVPFQDVWPAKEHLLFRADGSTVPASAVQCNDHLASDDGPMLVSSVRRSKSAGGRQIGLDHANCS